MTDLCHSCSAPLSGEFKGTSVNYCKYCTDEKGALLPREAIKKGITQWLKGWQPGLGDEEAVKRAEYYMKAMPAWADRE